MESKDSFGVIPGCRVRLGGAKDLTISVWCVRCHGSDYRVGGGGRRTSWGRVLCTLVPDAGVRVMVLAS